MASAQETLSGQAYGARHYDKVGTQTYTAILCLILVCFPISIVWMYVESLLRFVGQDPEISHEAGKFIMWLIPTLFGYASLQPLTRYYQMQSLIPPMLISSGITICFHAMVCWMLVFKSGCGSLGSAGAMGISTWLNVAILGLFMKFSSTCARTRAPISMKMFEGVRAFFAFAVPSALMICLEWWSYELLILLSGLLPNPQLETSVLSVSLNVICTVYAIPTGLASAGSTRISNELGAGRPEGARLSVIALMLFTAVDAIAVSGSLFAGKNLVGCIFSNEKEVQDYIANMAPLLCSSVVVDNIQATLSGVARGCGWQHIGACINLVAFYLFGIPVAAVLSFWWDFRGCGLWIGVLAGAALQTALFGAITACTDWDKRAIEAKERLLEEKPDVEDAIN
ncbi:protein DETOXIFICATION 12-like isoform X2 [Andrographis paniculata]|nr:protein DETOXIFICATION 12-like isoform X2 [Andrographis paniculata]XP_051148797.1 protein DETOXIFICATION 12-like isoform X2 [Andrographis paniculata]